MGFNLFPKLSWDSWIAWDLRPGFSFMSVFWLLCQLSNFLLIYTCLTLIWYWKVLLISNIICLYTDVCSPRGLPLIFFLDFNKGEGVKSSVLFFKKLVINCKFESFRTRNWFKDFWTKHFFPYVRQEKIADLKGTSWA